MTTISHTQGCLNIITHCHHAVSMGIIILHCHILNVAITYLITYPKFSHNISHIILHQHNHFKHNIS